MHICVYKYIYIYVGTLCAPDCCFVVVWFMVVCAHVCFRRVVDCAYA